MTDPTLAPRANPDLFGQEDAERELMDAFASGRLPHAWLIGGLSGVGKATLAFRFARYLFAPDPARGTSLAIDPKLPVFRRVAAGGHADLLTIQRELNEAGEKLRKEIAVDDVRRITPFLRLTPAEGGWRVVIVDGADTMNRAGQNAILKILEEPPRRALLMLLTERPSALLPTIRSRCRVLMLPPLSDAIVGRAIANARPDIDAASRVAIAALAEGSIGRALEIAETGSLPLLSEFLSIAGKDILDWPAAHGLGDRLALAAADESYRSWSQLLTGWLARVARDAASGPDRQSPGPELIPGEKALRARLVTTGQDGRLEPALEVWEKLSHLFARSDGANLDRRLTVISAFDMVAALR